MNSILSEKQTEDNVFRVNWNHTVPEIDRKELYISLGYKGNQPDAGMIDMIEHVISRIPELTEPNAGYRIVSAGYNADRKEGILMNDVFFHTDRIISGQLKNVTRAAVFVCTIGRGLELWAAELVSQGDPALGFITDMTASVYVETLTDILHDHIGAKMQADGLSITNRFSPGYCGWEVQEQHRLFSLLPDEFCGIALSESAFMSPKKSVSGIIGIGSEVQRRAYLCDSCNRENCIYRLKRLNNNN